MKRSLAFTLMVVFLLALAAPGSALFAQKSSSTKEKSTQVDKTKSETTTTKSESSSSKQDLIDLNSATESICSRSRRKSRRRAAVKFRSAGVTRNERAGRISAVFRTWFRLTKVAPAGAADSDARA